jgi:putative membrane protein
VWEKGAHSRFRYQSPNTDANWGNSLQNLYNPNKKVLNNSVNMGALKFVSDSHLGENPMMHGFGFGYGGWFVMILFWGLLIVGAVWLIRSLFSGGTNPSFRKSDGEGSAKDILDRRYARGELSREEYDTMKQDLANNK